MLNNIVDNLEQCGQQIIVQCCFHQARTGCAFFAVYELAQIKVSGVQLMTSLQGDGNELHESGQSSGL